MSKRTILLGVLGLALLGGCVRVQVDPVEATLNVNIRDVTEDLDSYFAYESREKYPLFNELKDQGVIGETNAGYVEAVKPEAMAQQMVKTIVEGVNRDRAMIYGTLAKKNGKSVEDIATQNAVRNFGAARPGQMLKYSDGWKAKL